MKPCNRNQQPSTGKLPVLLVFFLLLTITGARAQLYNFRNFSPEHGLPEARISTLCEDRRGNLWIGTLGGGLIRFDGFTFQTYVREDGVVSNFIHAVFEDHAGKLWIGTEEGICTYDGIRFSPFGGLDKQTITDITQDSTHHYWFATAAHGLYRFDHATLTQYTTRQGLNDMNIRCLRYSPNGDLWIGTGKGIGKYKDGRFRFFAMHDIAEPGVRSITGDSFGNLWLATAGGIVGFDGENFTLYNTRHGLRSNDVHAVLHDRKGNLWAGTSAGISKYNGKTFDHYDAHTGQGVQAITRVYQDAGGNLWFGSAEKGLSRLDSERFIHYPENDQMGKRVYAIIQAINGNMICGTSLGGTTVFDGKQYTLLDGIEGFTSSIVQAFYYTPDSTLWVGTRDEGAYQFSKSQFKKFTVDDGLASNNITGFAIDGAGSLWLATGDSGVSVMMRTADSVFHFQNYASKNGLSSNRISAIAYDGLGNIWLGTEDKGVSKITPADSTQAPAMQHYSVAEGLSSNVIHTIVADSSGHLFIGTGRGLTLFDGRQFRKLTKADGLVSNNIYSLTLDDRGTLWAGTERGVDRIFFSKNFSETGIYHFGSDEGFKGVEVYRNSSCRDRDGNLWFGTMNGLVKYNPREEVEPGVTPQLHITGVKLFFDNIEDTPYADSITPWYAIPIALTLPYHQNNLTFSFAGIHHRNPQAVRYKWMLEGFSPEWSPALIEREATFSNLPPGHYTFKVIASNEYNRWSEAPAQFAFVIEPPFWERWWVRLLGLAAVIGLVWLIFYLRVKRIKAKNKAIQEKLEMEKNILELEQEAARLQMNPHFIFNSLNSIQGFISTNDAAQAKKYLAKFARLMRLILENAREEFIPLRNEMSMLENFMELEKLSTNSKFEFSVTADERLDPDQIEIPPMMIQPFVENAIIHGIRKKEGKGNISVHFALEDGVIRCDVTDDGVGRVKAAAINGQGRPNHKSTAISVTRQRLEQYGMHLKVRTGIEIVDLEKEGVAAGTRVVIRTPYEGEVLASDESA